MAQILLPIDSPKPLLRRISYRQRLEMLLRRDLGFHAQKNTHFAHKLHAFPAKFPPQLPRTFILELTNQGDTVFDPMMGSCTTLIEAVLLKRKAIGCDIDPLSILIGKAKLHPLLAQTVHAEGVAVTQYASRAVQETPADLQRTMDARFDAETREFIDYWFHPVTQLELIALIVGIERVKLPETRNFLLMLFSSVIITKSGGVSFARDLAHTRPHRVDEKKIVSAITEFHRKLHLSLRELTEYHESDYHIFEADARAVPIQDHSVDLIVTSPPYPNNAIDYMRAHKFSLVWMGYSIEQLRKLRAHYIGHDTANHQAMERLPGKVVETIQKLQRIDERKARVLERYYIEMSQVLKEMYRVLRTNRAAILVVGDSVMRGFNTQTPECLAITAQEIGFEHVHTGIRRLDRDKRMMPARWEKNSKNGIEARIHEEYIIGLLKST